MEATNSQNISFYNEMAADYDAIMDQERPNAAVRRRVADKFQETVAAGARVLDFGGGTGADLDWLTEHRYQVLFCEPSKGMVERAKRREVAKIPGSQINFLSGTSVDFTGWLENPPFAAPVDAVLANFAVINCIRNIDLLFRSLGLALRPEGDLIAVLLRPKIRHELRSLVGLKTETQDIRYKDNLQTVYIHSTIAIRKASAPFFYFSSPEPLQGSVFSLFHLTRK